MSYKHINTLKGLSLDQIKDFSKQDTSHYFKVKKWDISHDCGICGEAITELRLATLDHIVPKFMGGRTREHNIRLAHMKCNSSRKYEDEFPDWILEKATTPMRKNTPCSGCGEIHKELSCQNADKYRVAEAIK